jgi:cob(I)alamin adenosyltransferase
MARAICRRAERRVVSLARTEQTSEHVQVYLNRLSDLLFVLCRILARDEGGIEVLWRNPGRD